MFLPSWYFDIYQQMQQGISLRIIQNIFDGLKVV